MCNKCSVQIKVVNKHHGHQADGDRKVYIGRGSPLGNPWPISPGFPRRAVIELYRGWLQTMIEIKNPKVIEALDEIALRASTGGVDLVCFCAPSPCHGDVIKEIIITKLNSINSIVGEVESGPANSA